MYANLGEKKFANYNDAEHSRRQITAYFKYYAVVVRKREYARGILIDRFFIDVETSDHRKFRLKGYKDVQKFCASEKKKIARARARKDRIARGKNHWYNDLLDFIYGSMHN